MNPDLAALLDHVRRNPDDATRLVLADWLEENGDALDQARARWIRLEVEVRSSRPLEVRLRHEAQRLRRQHARAWLGELADVYGVHEWHFDRGLVWLVVSFLFLEPRGLAQLYGQPGWPWVEGLKCCMMGTEGARALAGCPGIASLGWLDLSNNQVG